MNLFKKIWILLLLDLTTSLTSSSSHRRPNQHLVIRRHQPPRHYLRLPPLTKHHYRPPRKYKSRPKHPQLPPNTHQIAPNHFVHFCSSDARPSFPDLSVEEVFPSEVNEHLHLNVQFSNIFPVQEKPESHIPEVAPHEEFIEIPIVNNPPLDKHHQSATYDTPGAKNSYGEPANLPPILNKPAGPPDFQHFFEVNLEEYDQTTGQASDLVTVSESNSTAKTDKIVRHPNHRYDDEE